MSWLWGATKKENIDSTGSGSIFTDGTSSSVIGNGDHMQDEGATRYPLFALDQLKMSGIPLQNQVAPYLQMDPSVFTNATPQIIMPEGYEHGRGKFEMALGFIGLGIGGAFLTGCLRGGVAELFNRETMKLPIKPMFTRLTNATVKYGSGYAQTVGAVTFMYSAIEIFSKTLRGADDVFNSIGAGTLTGAIYRSPHGMRASLIGAAFGSVASVLVDVARNDYDRIDKILRRLRSSFKAS